MAPPRRSKPEPSDADDPGDEPIMDRRIQPDRRSGADRREKDADGAAERRAGSERRQSDRRKARPPRNINQYDMSEEALEFVRAVNRFRELSGNRFPSAKDILEILKDLGYEKRS